MSKTSVFRIDEYIDAMTDVLASFEEAHIDGPEFVAILANAYPFGELPRNIKYQFAEEQQMFEEQFILWYPYIHEMLQNAGVTKKPEMAFSEYNRLVVVHGE